MDLSKRELGFYQFVGFFTQRNCEFLLDAIYY